jgi:hypothetical protein
MSVFPIAEFGDLVTTVDVDDAVVATLKMWLPTYLTQFEQERDLAPGFLSRPNDSAYANTLESDEFLDHTLPAVIVTTAATADPPVITNNWSYIANWRLTVSSVLRGRRPPETRRSASYFEGSVRRLLVQKGDLGGLAKRCRWISSTVAPLPDRTGKGRYLAAGITQMVVFGDVAVEFGVGPDIPDAGSYEPLATVQDVTTDVEGVTTIPTED